MACPTSLSGLALGCLDTQGGIKEIYVALEADVTSVELSAGLDAPIVSAITMTASAKFKKFAFRKQTGSLTSTVANDDAAGTSFVTTELALQFTKQEAIKRLEIQSLINVNSKVIVKDSNGTYFYLGKDNPVNCTAATAISGQAYGDHNGYTLTLQDISKELPYTVDPTIVADLIG